MNDQTAKADNGKLTTFIPNPSEDELKKCEEYLKNREMAKVKTLARKDVLEQAMKAVCSDREQQYGTPENSFKAIAEVWSWYLDKEIAAKDVALMMCLFKSARVKTGRFKEDNWIDLIGYAACGAELEGME